jgi:hypothetical protein
VTYYDALVGACAQEAPRPYGRGAAAMRRLLR